MGKNGYLERRKVRDTVMQDAIRQTYQQYMTDMLILTLNDPEVMGKDVFGYKRLKKVLDAWGKNYDKYLTPSRRSRRQTTQGRKSTPP